MSNEFDYERYQEQLEDEEYRSVFEEDEPFESPPPKPRPIEAQKTQARNVTPPTPVQTPLASAPVESISIQIDKASENDLAGIIKDLAQMEDSLDRDLAIIRIVKKFRVPRKSILSEIDKTSTAIAGADKAHTECSTSFEGLIDMAEDEDGEPVFIIESLLGGVVGTRDKAINDMKRLVPPPRNMIPFVLPRASEICAQSSLTPSSEIFIEVTEYIGKYCYLTEEQMMVVTAFIFASYLADHKQVRHLPILYMFGPAERGKSKLGKATIFASYRGVAVNDIRSAHLIRYSKDYGASIFIDLRSAWNKVKREGCDDIILGRFEKGHKVMRVIAPEKGSFQDSAFYPTFGSTIIASNQSIDDILESRCIPITMVNHNADFADPSEEDGRVIREKLVFWRSLNLKSDLPEVEYLPELAGRLWSISKPLLQVCRMVYPQGYELLVDYVKSIADERKHDKQFTIEAIVLKAIEKNLGMINSGLLPQKELLIEINSELRDSPKITPQFLGKKLKNMGFKHKTIQGYSYLEYDQILFRSLCKDYNLLE